MCTKDEKVKFARQAVYSMLDIIMLLVTEPCWSKSERLDEIRNTCSQIQKEINEKESVSK